ncbi:MAG: hypothetical protein AAF393_12905 [Pseudomonadota bacterium]
MIRPIAVAGLMFAAPPAAANTVVGQWHCLQTGPEVRVEAVTNIANDGTFTAEMEFILVGPNGRMIVSALYAAEWKLDGDAFWDNPLDARVIGVTVNGEPAEAPQVTEGILQSLREPPDGPLRIDFDGPDVVFFRPWDDNGAPFECIRSDGETIGL